MYDFLPSFRDYANRIVSQMVEDILQASLHGFVDAVRIADVGQGTNPVRIVSMRALADQPGYRGYLREEWAGLDQDEESQKPAASANENRNVLGPWFSGRHRPDGRLHDLRDPHLLLGFPPPNLDSAMFT